MRVSVSKKAHQTLLLEVAASLKSDDPKVGLEHILNCWLAPSHPLTPPTNVLDAAKLFAPPEVELTAISDW